MNERIKELALQSNIKYSTRDDVFYSAAFDGVHRPDMERFAELIVKECSYRCYLIGEYQMAHELSDLYGFKFDFKKMMEEDDE